jgi:RNA polymerase sigma-70 factor, ECF subfamily
MRRENVNLTLQPTALVNELWLRLATGNPDIDWQDRSHFFAICTRMMQKTLIDFGRRRSTEKRGAGLRFVPAEKYDPGEASSFPDLVALELALEKLARHDPRKAKVFELRFWGGLEVGEIAEVLEVSETSIARDWRFVKAFLKKELFPDFATQSASESD